MAIAIVALCAGAYTLGDNGETPSREVGFTPEVESETAPLDSEVSNDLVQAPATEQRHPEGQPEVSEPEPLPPAPPTGFQLISRVLRVPLSYACVTPEDSPENAISLDMAGRFDPVLGDLSTTAYLRDFTNARTLTSELTPKALPEGRVQLSDLCTLLLDSPAGLLPKIEDTHAAFLSGSGRLKPAKIASIEEVPTGWLLRLEEPEEFCANETIDRVLLCVDPPVKDHVRVASWLLSDLRNATSVELRPLETHTLPLAWKGIGHMGNLAAEQAFKNVFFSGSSEHPGFQTPAALDWLAAPPTRNSQSTELGRTFDRIPKNVNSCAGYFSLGSLGQADLPHTDNWKFGVELFPEYLKVPSTIDRAATDINEMILLFGRTRHDQSFVWGPLASLMGASAQPKNTGRNPVQGQGEPAEAREPEVWRTDDHYTLAWTVLDKVVSNHAWHEVELGKESVLQTKFMDNKKSGRIRFTNTSGWEGKGTVFLLANTDSGPSLRPIAVDWPRDNGKRHRLKEGEFAWFVTSPTAKGSFGLIGKEGERGRNQIRRKSREENSVDLELVPGWSSLLVGQSNSTSSPYAEKVQVEQLSYNDNPVEVRKPKGYSPVGGSIATSAMAGSPITKRIGPWGIQLLNSETLPVFMDLGFVGSPMLRLQPGEDTVALLLKLSQ